jgi:hypothetical protein
MTNRTTPVGTVDEELDLLILRARERQAAVAVPDCIEGAQQRLDAARQQLLNRVERLTNAGNEVARTLKANKAGLVDALPRRELSIRMSDLDEWNRAALTGEHNG